MKPQRITTDLLQEVKRRFGIVGNSPAINGALAKAIQVAPTDLTVLLQGESGVGKEVFARLIHNLSKRRHKPYVAVNCAAIPEGTMDSELFGHEKGAFTGAYESRKGYFEYADGGTIFLDEVSEMPPETQAKLLRVLETGEFMRVGSSQTRHTDVRVIAASNKDLQKLVEEGKFREDLYYRLSVVPIHIPPLRERGEDIIMLFRKFAADFASKYGTEPLELTPDAEEFLLQYPWPGNVRQLKHLVEQLTVLLPDRIVTRKVLEENLPRRNDILPALRTDGLLPTVSEHPSTAMAGIAGNSVDILPILFRMYNDIQEIKGLVVDLWDQERQRTQLPPSENVEKKEDDEVIPIDEMEKRLIIKALKKFNGRRRDAAKALGISERTLYRKIKEYNIEV
ncbi:MAG: sigma-54-dependent Fis family transcriptional regulator [Chlorobi bacterium]|nr:sigma-54-dependent Fis family transcriptional regulator [Chlorobiota bacterium]